MEDGGDTEIFFTRDLPPDGLATTDQNGDKNSGGTPLLSGARTQKRNIDVTLLSDSAQGLSKAMDELSGDEGDPHASPSKKKGLLVPPHRK
jgi:hypothetical protein